MRCLIFFVLAGMFFSQPACAFSIDQVKREMIQQSISEYPGNCACPYNTDKRGRSCGKRSAYSREGGYSVLCYPKDINKTDVDI